ncbi:phenylacetic acid degradation PaaB family protein [Haloferax namakaokahaiae]|uniref:Phenylacetic acid degradation PaaB family protein n=1 Tax=Haloferax namakaokahaiae TaxID=1748331 RepID=A0ABD5ZE48_9EURY
MKYHVFTRNRPGDDLIHAGTVQADSDRLARIYAHRTYDEEAWEFMGVVREDNLLEVDEEPISSRGVA